MNKKALAMLAASFMLVCSAAAQNSVFTISGHVKDKAGNGISGVVVCDAVNFTQTDASGKWTLTTDTCISKFIRISTPAAYKLPQSEGLAAGFYVRTSDAARTGSHDFILEKRDKPSDSFYYIAISDPQVRNAHDMNRWKREAVRDIKQTNDSLGNSRDIIGMTLGDLVFDNMSLYGEYKSSLKNCGMTVFQCIGNHDFEKAYQDLHNTRYGSPVYGEMYYHKYFGPTDYSFNIGKVHVVTLKSLNYIGNRAYIEDLTDAQIAWLEKDLSYVPKGSLVFLNMHAAAWNKVSNGGNIRNASELARVLSGYNAHVFCGHTHYYQNIEVTPSLYQHNIGAACGAWWATWYNTCGAPNGYLIVDVNGNDVKWHYKSTGYPLSHQIHLYAQGEFASQKNYVVANVWDIDSKSKIVWYQDGKAMGEMEQFTDADETYVSRFLKPRKKNVLTAHLFRCKPQGNYKELKVEFTNRFGETYSEVLRPHIEIIAHRGGAGLYPENTIPAMRNALSIGVHNLEMDMHITKDSLVVVSHDPYLKGYDKQYPIFANSYSTLRALPIGVAKDKNFPKSKRIKTYIPLVTELIDSVETYSHDHNLDAPEYTIEIKSSPKKDGVLSPAYTTFADLCVSALKSRGLGSRLLLQCFDVRTLKYLHKSYPVLRLLYLVDKNSGSLSEAMNKLGFTPYAISPDFQLITPEFVQEAHKMGMKVIPYTVDDKENTAKMKAAGVDAIITNYPDKMAKWLKE